MNRVWQKSYPAGIPTDIDPDEYASINALFEHSCNAHVSLPAFSNFGIKLTYAELEKKSRHFAAYLQQGLKLKKGDRVAVMLPNLLQYPVAVFGILRAGLVVVNLNPLYTAPEIQHLVNNSGAETMVVLANFAKTVEMALEKITLRHIIITEIGDLLGRIKKPLVNYVVRYIKRMVPSYSLPNTMTFCQALSRGSEMHYQPPEVSGQDMAFLQYTGGTTGQPKAALLTHRNMVANVLQCKAWVDGVVEKPGEDIVLGALPLYHIFSLTVCCLTFMALGAECLLITNPRQMKSFLGTLSKVPVTIFIGLNTLFNGMMHHPAFSKVDFSRLKLTVSGGMAMQTSVAEAWHKKTGVPVVQGYGLTEASPVVSINPINLKTFSNSVGLPIPSTDVEIRDNELCVRGPQVMQGYWQDPEETAKVLSNDGWLLTGDIAQIDEKGLVYLIDRKKDMILVSGFNVYPNEIEAVLVSHPDIKEAAVIGISSEQTGEAVKAFIVKENDSLTEQLILDYCHQSLTGYKIPKIIAFCDELPKSAVGKVLRKVLKEGWQGEGQI